MTEEAPWPQMDRGRPVPPGGAPDPAALDAAAAPASAWKQPPVSMFNRIKGAVLGRPVADPGLDPSLLDPSLLEPGPIAPDPADGAPDEVIDEPVAVEPEPPQPKRPPCRQCGGEVDADDYCTQCGARAPSEREHFEESPAGWVGAVCDRGVRHARNEDGMAVAALPGWGSHAVLVVCDGVTTSDDSDVAALAAARAARDSLAEAPPEGGTVASQYAAAAASLTLAAALANDAVISHSADSSVNPPACTFVAAVVDGGSIIVGNVGDSRAYWLPDGREGKILTRDDSLAEDSIASGVPRKEAEEAADAHTITRWLGVDAENVLPHIASHAVDGPGWLLVCSDGLWNYASEPAAVAQALAGALAATAGTGAPVDVARALTDWANAQGGHDNVSVCLARLGVAEPVPEPVQVSGDTVRIRRVPDPSSATGAPASSVPDAAASSAAEPASAPTTQAQAAADGVPSHTPIPTAAGLLQAHEAATAGVTPDTVEAEPDASRGSNGPATPLEG